MGKTYETSENAKADFLKTHYYKTTSEQLLKYIPTLLETKYSFKILTVNDDYNEICAYNNNFDLTVKVIMSEINQTAVDFFITSRYLFDINKTKNLINEIYDSLSKEYPFIGLALNKGSEKENK